MKTLHKPVIIIDLGGVYFTNGQGIAHEKLTKKLKVPEDKVWALMKSTKNPIRKKYLIGKATGKQYWNDFAKKLNLSQKQAQEAEELWNSAYKPQKGMPQLVKKLRKKYRIVILSGNVKDRVAFLQKKYKVLDQFHEHHFSYDYGYTKPDVRLFTKAIKKMNVQAEDCILVDDYPEFLQVVEAQGAKTIFFKTPEQLEKDLRKLGVKI